MILYRERVLPSAANLSLPILLFPSALAVMLPINAPLSLPVAALVTVSLVLILFFRAPTISVTSESLSAKNAVISRKYLGEARVISKGEMFQELGPNLDARAWLSIQASVKGLVRVEIKDPNDPTPYWLISTRKPEVLVETLND